MDLYTHLDLADAWAISGPLNWYYQAPDHLTKDLKLKWREVLIGLGYPPAGSAPAEQ